MSSESDGREDILGPMSGTVTHVSTARRLNYTYEDYLRALEDSRIKLEYCDGQIYAMAGGTPAHAELAMRAGHLLMQSLQASCRVYSSDLRVRIDATDLSTFPDVAVVCGPREMSAVDPQAVTNPTILVEVTSPSTETYDRGEKLRHYQTLPSLRLVLFVSHDSKRVTAVRRPVHSSDEWDKRDFGPGQHVEASQPQFRLSIDSLYDGVEFEVS